MIFPSLNHAYNATFQPNKLSIGLVVPIERYDKCAVPTMKDHLARVQLAEQLGFSSVWLRDVPLNLPSFGDAGQTFDPFAYLGFLAGQTERIGLGVASIALPLHHPVHVAKSAATIDQLGQGRMLMGIASGDRFEEYPAMGIDYDARGARFREAYHVIRDTKQPFPTLVTEHFGNLDGNSDILPKPFGEHLPMLITGNSRQSPAWIAEHGDGWMSYPRSVYAQQNVIAQWREQVAKTCDFDKPFMQPLYIDLQADPNAPAIPIHLGLRTGINALVAYLKELETIGVNHVALNLRFNQAEIDDKLQTLGEKILPSFGVKNDR